MLQGLFTLLKLVNLLAGWAHDQGLMNQGAKLEVGKQLASIATKSGASAEARAAIAQLSDSDLDSELRGDT